MNISKTKNDINVVSASEQGYSDILDSINNDNFTNIIDGHLLKMINYFRLAKGETHKRKKTQSKE